MCTTVFLVGFSDVFCNFISMLRAVCIMKISSVAGVILLVGTIDKVNVSELHNKRFVIFF